MPAKTRTPIAVARKQAVAMIASDTLPTIAALAKKWNCSPFRVSYVLKQVRGGKTAGKRGRPAQSTTTVVRKPAKRHPLFSRISTAMEDVERQLKDIEQHLFAIPNATPADVKPLLRKGHASVWQTFYTELTNIVDAVSELVSGGSKKRGRRKKKVVKKIEKKA